jgi:hypothetical protein
MKVELETNKELLKSAKSNGGYNCSTPTLNHQINNKTHHKWSSNILGNMYIRVALGKTNF